MAGTPRTEPRSTEPRTLPLSFYSGGKESSRRDRRMEAKFEALEKDFSSLNEKLLSLTQKVDFLTTEFKEFRSSTDNLVSNKMGRLEQHIDELDRLLAERNEQQLPKGAKPAKRRKIPNELSVRCDSLTCALW